MKLFITALLLTSTTIFADHQTTNLKRNVYTAKCTYSVPLYTSDRCSEHSYIGREVSACAADKAMDQCESGYNFDCMKVAVTVKAKSLLNFPGFRKCIATVRVHGYGSL